MTIHSAQIGQLRGLVSLSVQGTLLARLPSETGQLTSLYDLILNRTLLDRLPADILMQGTAGRLVYLTSYETKQAQQIILIAAVSVGSIMVLMLAFWWRQTRGHEKKKKRE